MLTKELSQLHANMISHNSASNGDDLPSRSVYAVKHWYDQRRIIYLEPAVKTDDLKDGCKREDDKGENRCGMTKLIPGVLV